MSSDNKSILRSDKTKDAENLDLPRWDRLGNLVSKPAKKKLAAKVKPTKVEDVPEESVKVPTVKDIEAIREEAYNEGFEQGYQNGLKQGQHEGLELGKAEGKEQGHEEGLTLGAEQGLEKALAEEREKTTAQLAVFVELNTALKNQISIEQDEIKEALLSISMRIARQTLQDELRLKPSHISCVVLAAIKSLANADEKLTVRLIPQDLDFVATFAVYHWTLVGDETIEMGGCTIKSGFSYVDFTLEHRFDAAVSHLVSQLNGTVDTKRVEPFSEDYLMGSEDSLAEVTIVEETKAEESITDVPAAELPEHENPEVETSTAGSAEGNDEKEGHREHMAQLNEEQNALIEEHEQEQKQSSPVQMDSEATGSFNESSESNETEDSTEPSAKTDSAPDSALVEPASQETTASDLELSESLPPEQTTSEQSITDPSLTIKPDDGNEPNTAE
jgi:flagellar assembly protein FliH